MSHGTTPRPGDAQPPDAAVVPGGLVTAVVNLVHTGPVMLGAYTVAELTAVDAVVDFLEARPSHDELTEAVRSLAARQLLLAGDSDGSGEQVQVRGDLGIAVAFEQRARMVLDARVTGTRTGEPWRFLLLPQPERICLIVRIDALGVHQLSLHTMEEGLRLLTDWLPRGDAADPDEQVSDTGALLAEAERSALVTVTHYTAEGSAEIAGRSTDLVLALHDGHLHVLTRDGGGHGRLVPARAEGKDAVRDRIAALLA